MAAPLIGTLVEGDKDPSAAIRTLAPLGFESFSVIFWQTLGGVDLEAMADKVRAAAERAGVIVSCVSIYGNILGGAPVDEETLRGYKRLIDTAGRFGSPLVSGFTGRIPGRPFEESIKPWKKAFGELLNRAEARGVRIAMENCRMGGTWKTGNWNLAIGPDAWEVLFNEIPTISLGLEWEPCHQLLCLADPVGQLERWGPRILHVHGKDANIDWNIIRGGGLFGKKKWAVQRTAGFGDSDWEQIMRGLVRTGYAGCVDIEGWHDPVYKDDREIEGQVLGLQYLLGCRERALAPVSLEHA
jgi:sugar phosphate isomerase/epimerase